MSRDVCMACGQLASEDHGCKPPEGTVWLVVRYDVTGFTPAQIDALAGEAVVQGEENDEPIGGAYHPDAPVTYEIVGGD